VVASSTLQVCWALYAVRSVRRADEERASHPHGLQARRPDDLKKLRLPMASSWRNSSAVVLLRGRLLTVPPLQLVFLLHGPKPSACISATPAMSIPHQSPSHQHPHWGRSGRLPAIVVLGISLSMWHTMLSFVTCMHHFGCISMCKAIQWFCLYDTKRLHECYIRVPVMLDRLGKMLDILQKILQKYVYIQRKNVAFGIILYHWRTFFTIISRLWQSI
jgi:hypothetical protein